MNHVKVSVIVPVYNVENYLAKCLTSLVEQTLSAIEIVVVNDGSPDNSQAIIDDFAARYPDKIRPLHKQNGGLSDARNFGVAHATGEYIAFVDSDDYVDTDMYRQMYQKAADCDADVVCCPFTEIIGERMHPNDFGDRVQHFGHSVTESPRILRTCNSFAWNKIYRRTFWNAHGFQFPVGQWFEDSALVYNVLGAANRVDCVNAPFYYYLKSRGDSITNTADARILDIFKSLTALLTYYQALPQTDALQDEVTYLCLRHTLARIRMLDRVADKQVAKRFVDECFHFYNQHLPHWRKNSFFHPKKASIKTFVRNQILRHRTLTRLCYTNRLLKSSGKAVLNLKQRLRKRGQR